MPRSIPALVKPELLVWARMRSGFALEAAASKAGIEPERLSDWETGEEQPSIPQLRKLGEAYRRPLAVFFLPTPPTDFDPQREFRRLPGLPVEKESPEMRVALRMALFRRQAALDLFERLGERLPEIPALAHPQEQAEEVGRRIRQLLSVSWDSQLQWASAYGALNEWRSRIERLGILVFQTGDVSLKEMRGTSIPHGPLPLILLNNSDSPLGRVFTLLHELAHILLSNGGHRTSAMESRSLPEDRRLEVLSNGFAAAALMPREDFLQESRSHPGALVGDEGSLRHFANRIKVSPEAILRRLVSLRRIPASVYRQKRRVWQSKPWFGLRESSGGPPIEVRIVSSLGRPFTSLVIDAYHRNAVSSGDVVDFLGVQLKHLNRVARQLAPEPGTGVET
jgi:Zn-dependent peptidase ImmA (M78 family)/transcriptional regulator with XRE-family HTH domain